MIMSMFSVLQSMAELQPLNEDELVKHTGQTGITLSSKVEFGGDTRISYSNTDADLKDKDTWLVINQLTGSIELKGLDIDLESGLGPQRNKSAVVVTLPEEIIFDELKTEGIYVGPGRDKSPNHRFLMAVEVDGVLQMPGATKINVFPAEKSTFVDLN
ncbi:hypothetical protein [Bacterioplanoides sp.]|uniref:hypothetical protein n=1 Tax=Bacterioplanoides sp. TaxID=2066072 RepID=UPI003B5A911B